MNVLQTNRLVNRITSGKFGQIKFLDALDIARELGYDNINDDQIANQIKIRKE